MHCHSYPSTETFFEHIKARNCKYVPSLEAQYGIFLALFILQYGASDLRANHQWIRTKHSNQHALSKNNSALRGARANRSRPRVEVVKYRIAISVGILKWKIASLEAWIADSWCLLRCDHLSHWHTKRSIANDNIPNEIFSHHCHELFLLEVSKVRYIWANFDRPDLSCTHQHLQTPRWTKNGPNTIVDSICWRLSPEIYS